jgi:hypothetical protein
MRFIPLALISPAQTGSPIASFINKTRCYRVASEGRERPQGVIILFTVIICAFDKRFPIA